MKDKAVVYTVAYVLSFLAVVGALLFIVFWHTPA